MVIEVIITPMEYVFQSHIGIAEDRSGKTSH